jgi:hypothetical protein
LPVISSREFYAQRAAPQVRAEAPPVRAAPQTSFLSDSDDDVVEAPPPPKPAPKKTRAKKWKPEKFLTVEDEEDPPSGVFGDRSVGRSSGNFRSHFAKMTEEGLDWEREERWLHRVPARLLYLLRRGVNIIRGWRGKQYRERRDNWIQKTTDELNQWAVDTKGEEKLGLGNNLMKYVLKTAKRVFPLYDRLNP